MLSLFSSQTYVCVFRAATSYFIFFDDERINLRVFMQIGSRLIKLTGRKIEEKIRDGFRDTGLNTTDSEIILWKKIMFRVSKKCNLIHNKTFTFNRLYLPSFLFMVTVVAMNSTNFLQEYALIGVCWSFLLALVVSSTFMWIEVLLVLKSKFV